MDNMNQTLFTCQQMFRHACAFSDCADFAKKEFDPGITNVEWYTTPAIVNSAFACEVFLKALLLYYNIPVKNEHKLKDLYELLPQNDKEQIKQETLIKYPVGWKDGFGLERLEHISDAFVKWRYNYEHVPGKKGSMHIDIGFLNAFRNTLRDVYYITEILKIIDSLSYSDEWATITIELYNKGFIQEMPLSGKVFFFHNPYKFVEFVSHDPSRRFSEQWKFSLPANACDEYDALVFFVKTLIESDNMSLAGSIIGKIPGDEDGVRLNERIRELLEYVDDTEFDNAVISGIINAIGLRAVTDGTDRKALSVKYEKDALSMELFHPHAAYVLHTLSRFYLNEGKQDYIQSEIYDY